MHHKFIAIDDRAVWAGSYNFTFNAQRNYETLLRLDDPGLVAQFHAEASACAAAKVSIDRDGMYQCISCERRFYADEGMYIGDYGDVFCPPCYAKELGHAPR
jgi:phosphatidylserine/phosphatidylglycerophosphate/cardiolipin synthase-like enzyme